MRYLLAVVLWGVTAGCALAAAPTIERGQLTICSPINRPPMEYFDDKQQPVGIDIDLGKAIAGQLGLRPVFLNIAFSGLIPALLARHCDMILAQLFINADRLKVIDEIPYMYSQTSLLLRVGEPNWLIPISLSGRAAVAVAGTTSALRLADANAELAAEHKPLINIRAVPGNIEALQALQYRQVDAYGVSYETASYYAALQPDVFKLGGRPYSKALSGIGMTKTNAALEAEVEAALARLRANGSYGKIFESRHLADDMLQ